MTLQELMDKALGYPAACAESPFGPDSICIRIGEHGPIFASLMPERGWISFRCEAIQGLVWREQFPGTVRRGYHCPPVQQPYFNTFPIDSIPDELILEMTDHSYNTVVGKLPKYKQKALMGENTDEL